MTTNSSQPLNGYVPATYVQLLADYLQDNPHSQRELTAETLSILGLATGESNQADQRVAVSEWQRMLVDCAAVFSNPALGLKLGRRVTAAHFGVLGYILLSCGTLAAALQRLQKFERLIYDVNPMAVAVTGDQVVLSWGVERGRPGSLVDETAIAALVQFCRDMLGNEELCPSKIEFVNSAPDDLAPYEAYFGCPVFFERTATTVSLQAHWLQKSLRSPDSGLIQILEAQAESQLKDLQDDDWATQVRGVLVQELRHGCPNLELVANKLNVSSRTLHRRLADEQTSFAKLLMATRKQLAENYLCDPALQLSEIALLLGYSEQSAFSRAYREWTNQTPLQARRNR